MATKMAPGFGPTAMTDGYSMSGSQANSVALKPGGTFSGGKRFSVAGPVGAGAPASRNTMAAIGSKRIPRSSNGEKVDVMRIPARCSAVSHGELLLQRRRHRLQLLDRQRG